MVVQHNLTALNANRYLGINNSKLSKSLEKLSSGYAINRAGDNAAGLAVSEKMRSQIAGMQQGVKNAQDGISMVQTFEGALTETDSILQRMKTLADQAANGTYQDDVDRDAIQLEFDQLNDELNQIADTDFNGVVVLNGGEMADGLRQVGGKFDYTAENVQASKDAKLAELNAQLKALKDSAPIDIFKDSAYNTIDENKYGLDQAKALWADDKLDLNAEKDAYVDVTYTAKIADDGTVSYEVTGAVTDSGKDLMAKADLFEATAVNATGDATGKGGFKVTGDADAEVNVIFDASKIKDGDVITVRYNGPGKSAKAPANAGFADDSITNNTANNANLTKEADLSVAVKVEDADMTSDIVSVFDALNGAEVKFQVAANSTTNAVKATAGSVKLNIGGADVTVTDAGAKVTLTDANGNSTEVWAAYANTGKLTLSTVNGTAKGTDLLEIDLGGWKNADTAIANASVKIAFDSYQAPSAGGVDAEVVASKGVGENEELNKQIAAVQKKIDDLNNGTGVSNSNAFGNGAIPLTYTDHIVLQSGARSKDAVDFTFRYSSGGMGKLKDNMNCSARADGLNTENLSLKTAEDANAAIDQIDHAINKVSMVRATFGAVQNRLEHKIDNMNVSIENLTSAESGIRDTNMPTEMMNFTKQQILAQASQSMLAQANQLPQSVLSLLQ